MKKLIFNTAVFFLMALIYACTPPANNENENNMDEDSVMQDSTGAMGNVELAPAPSSPEYSDAMLKLSAPTDSKKLSAGKVNFNYTVTNYELGAQTADASGKSIANSDQGQHIHLILNNEPYTAHYEPTFDMDMKDGHYVALSFLSRSYHESVKNPEAYNLIQFTVGNGQRNDVDLTKPHMFYSRPKGTYTGKDTENLLLDFYLVNADLSASGNKVRVTVNGNKEFMITEWKPYLLKGLPMGENTVKLELLDQNGNMIDSPFNGVERTFTLEEGNMPS